MAKQMEILRDSAKAYVRKALDILIGKCADTEPEVIRGLGEWVRRSNKMFVLGDRKFPPGAQYLLKHGEDFASTQEYASFASALREDSIIAPQLDTLIGTSFGGRRVTVDEVVNQIVWKTLDKGVGFKFEESEFDALFDRLLLDLGRDSFDYLAIAPLPLVKLDLTPIRLEDDLEMDLLADEEISRCLRLNVPVGISLGGNVHIPTRSGIRLHFTEEKRVGSKNDRTPAELESAIVRWTDQSERILAVVHALRLFKNGRVSCPGFIRYSENWPIDGSTHSGGLEPGSGSDNNYSLTSEEAMALPAFWSALREARKAPFLDMAIRRFGYAGERHRPEDRLVDLMIAAEALFLGEAGDATERGELRFRLSLRFAWFLEKDAASRRARFVQVRSAYDARSALVHGGYPKPSLLALPGEGRVALSRFVEATENQLRIALRKAIEIAAFSKTKRLDWDSMIFG